MGFTEHQLPSGQLVESPVNLREEGMDSGVFACIYVCARSYVP